MSQRLLEGHQEYVETVGEGLSNMELSARVESLNDRVEDLESKMDSVKRDAVVALLNLLVKSLKHVASGELDIENVETSPSKWEAVKKRQPPRIVEAIDILLAQGSLKRTQLALAMKMDYSNCTKNVVGVLKAQGLLNESGGLLSLKQL